MEIIAIGTDLVECAPLLAQIEKLGEVFLRKALTPYEIRTCRARPRSTEAFAGNWAAKEAVLKCLGYSGTRAPRGDIEIRGGEVHLSGLARDRAADCNINQILLSVAATRHYATATAIAVH